MLWQEAGAVYQGGMGITPLSWQEIVDWAERFFSENVVTYVEDCDGVFIPHIEKQHNLLDYELQLIRYMSQEYTSEYSNASDPSRPCPKEIIIEEVDGAKESMALGEAFIALFGGDKSKQMSEVLKSK